MRFGRMILAVLFVGVVSGSAAPIYLNDVAGVSVGLNSGALSGGQLPNIIDAPDASASEPHSGSTHAYISGNGAQMDLRFDLGADYTLTTFYLWNYEPGLSWSVDTFDIDFLAADMSGIGTFSGVSLTGGIRTRRRRFSTSAPSLACALWMFC